MAMRHRDIQTVIRALNKLSRATAGRRDMPPAIFDALLHLVTLATVETCILRRRQGRPEVFLTKRSGSESRYPDCWHVPGAFIRNGEDVAQTVARISTHELGGSAKITRPRFASFLNLPRRHFGHCVSLVHTCGLRGRPTNGQWFPVRRLPRPIVNYHPAMIRHAVRVATTG